MTRNVRRIDMPTATTLAMKPPKSTMSCTVTKRRRRPCGGKKSFAGPPAPARRAFRPGGPAPARAPLARGSAKDGQARACTPRSCSRLQGYEVTASGRPPGAARGRTTAPEAGGAWPRGIGWGRRGRHAGAAGARNAGARAACRRRGPAAPPPATGRGPLALRSCGGAGRVGGRGAYVTPPAPAGLCACQVTLEADRPRVPNVHPPWAEGKG